MDNHSDTEEYALEEGPQSVELDAAVEWLRATHKGTLSGARIEIILGTLARLTSENERLRARLAKS